MTLDEQIEHAAKAIETTIASIHHIEDGETIGGDPEKALVGLRKRLEQETYEKTKLEAKRAYTLASGG